jgi:hypothetical protein
MKKFTAIHDWKLAFHHVGELVDDFAALLSDGTVHAFMSRPVLDEEGMRLLGTSLMLNGIAMEVCGSWGHGFAKPDGRLGGYRWISVSKFVRSFGGRGHITDYIH